ncbi:putative secreted protein [hydrothermal vent metagenome]|uniref:Putative secreted protein n=1 Tax=hydrothermal vent metagenome TaxID=652676 RepID=A0A3B1E7V3_9ZZZZ
MTNSNPPRIAIIGAGPVGLEAALAATAAGFDVQLYERGTVAENVQSWGHIRLFSPFEMNSSALAKQRLRETFGEEAIPPNDAYLTGREFAEKYLLPISQLPELIERIHPKTKVLSIGRSHCWKRDFIGKPERAENPFVLLLQDEHGMERTEEAEIVLDCSGTYPHHHWMGAGGIPAVGETKAEPYIEYKIPDILGQDKEKYANKKTLLIGSGYSAATSIVALSRLAEESPQTKVIWFTAMRHEEPMSRIENDALPERDRLSQQVNNFVGHPESIIDWSPGYLVQSVQYNSESKSFQIDALFKKETHCKTGQGGQKSFSVDNVLANVGYRPCRQLYEELQIHECYASQGPIKLAATLLAETSPDCLQQAAHGVELLINPEPNFYILGAKSYGRDTRFLMKIGLQQVTDIIAKVTKNV